MSPELVGVIAGPLGAASVLVLKWIFDRRRNAAETGLTIDQRWERLADEYGERMTAAERALDGLKVKVAELEKSLHASEADNHSLRKLLRSTVRWALTLRDEAIRLGGTIPQMPIDVEFALTTLDQTHE